MAKGCYWRDNVPVKHGSAPATFILDSPAWQRGYDLAMEWVHEKRNAANPFSPDRPEFYGFEEGERDGERLRCQTSEANTPALSTSPSE